MARYAETERKYEAPSGMKLPDADRLFDLAVGSSDETELDATYFDTDDLRLARSGVTLRRRVGGDDGCRWGAAPRNLRLGSSPSSVSTPVACGWSRSRNS